VLLLLLFRYIVASYPSCFSFFFLYLSGGIVPQQTFRRKQKPKVFYCFLYESLNIYIITDFFFFVVVIVILFTTSFFFSIKKNGLIEKQGFFSTQHTFQNDMNIITGLYRLFESMNFIACFDKLRNNHGSKCRRIVLFSVCMYHTNDIQPSSFFANLTYYVQI